MARPPRDSFTLLLASTVAAACVLVITVFWSFSYQLSLKDEEIRIRLAYGEWNALLSDAKSLVTSSHPLGETASRFHARLSAFRLALAGRVREGDLRVDRFHDTLEFGLQYVDDLDTWLLRLASSTEYSNTSFADWAGKGPRELGWIRERLGALDDLFGANLARLSELLNDLILNDLQQASDRAVFVGYLVLAGMSAILAGLLVRIRRLNAHLNDLVRQRTKHLEHAQEKLIATEKLAVLGSLAAGVAHELNTPLAVMQSAGSSLSRFVEDTPRRIEAMGRASPEQRDSQRQLLMEVVGRPVPSYSGTDRAALRALAAELAARGAAQPELQAESWLELELEQAVWERFCLLPDIVEGLEWVRRYAEARRMASVIDQAVDRAGNVVSALRNYLGRRADERSSFLLREEWDSVFVLLGTRLRSGVKATLDIPSDLEIMGSRERLTQVWINLVNNALQAMEGHGSLAIRAEARGSRVLVTVTDSGPGVPMELHEEVFKPFFTTKKDTGGLGLGLDLCRKIVESHGGTLSLRSEPGHTVFSVDLPRSPTS